MSFQNVTKILWRSAYLEWLKLHKPRQSIPSILCLQWEMHNLTRLLIPKGSPNTAATLTSCHCPWSYTALLSAQQQYSSPPPCSCNAHLFLILAPYMLIGLVVSL